MPSPLSFFSLLWSASDLDVGHALPETTWRPRGDLQSWPEEPHPHLA